MIAKWRRSVYFKMFLSFLGICLLLFVGLALFWNYYFGQFAYKDQKEKLLQRSVEVSQLLDTYASNTISSREMRFGLRIIARSLNGGRIWLTDPTGESTITSDNDMPFPNQQQQPSMPLPDVYTPYLAKASQGLSGYYVGTMPGPDQDAILTYYTSKQIGDERVVMFLHIPVIELRSTVNAYRMIIWIPLLVSLAAVGLILYLLSRKLAGPLQHMNDTAISIAAGDLSSRIPISSNDEVGQLAHSINEIVRQLQVWEDSRQEFLANISHELRSPLTSLRGFIAAMNDQVIAPEKFPHYLQICDKEVQRLQRLVDELLDLARIQNGTSEFMLEQFDLAENTAEVVEFLVLPFRKSGITLELTDFSQIRPIVNLDADRYAQILNNLLFNAERFSFEGQVVSVAIRVEGSEAVVSVADQGKGMSEQEIERIWDRFYKADSSRGYRNDGTGLGLTIVKHLVKGMKGSIDVRSRVGFGTEFTLRFPLSVRTDG